MRALGPHNWWYQTPYTRRNRAGGNERSAASGYTRHWHTAGQHVLDHTGNLKALQKLLGMPRSQTTGDIYADPDVEHSLPRWPEVLDDDGPQMSSSRNRSR